MTPQGGDLLALGVGLRELVGLVVGDHLGAVLQRPQVVISLRQPAGVFQGDVAGRGQGQQGVHRARAAQVRLAAAQDQLLGLDEELDLADAAPAQFEVRALGGQAVVDLVGVDLALDRVDVGDGREIQVPSPDEGLKSLQERPSLGEIASGDPGLDVGRALPVLADALVVVHGRVDRHGRRGRGRVGAKAQVDAEDIAVGAPLLQHPAQVVGDPHRHGLGFDAVGDLQLLGRVEDREVDVAGIVQLERAVLAHCDAEQARRGAFFTLTDVRERTAIDLLPDRLGQGGAQGRVGEPGQGAGHLV
jgi:hypothetical protein